MTVVGVLVLVLFWGSQFKANSTFNPTTLVHALQIKFKKIKFWNQGTKAKMNKKNPITVLFQDKNVDLYKSKTLKLVSSGLFLFSLIFWLEQVLFNLLGRKPVCWEQAERTVSLDQLLNSF